MKTTMHSVLLAAIALCATSAFAATRAEVNVPFNFSSGGQSFPAGTYIATVDAHHNVLALSSASDPRISARWTAGRADSDPNNEKLTLTFDDLGNSHTLRTVQLGSRITSRLDAPAHHRNAGSTAIAGSGQ